MSWWKRQKPRVVLHETPDGNFIWQLWSDRNKPVAVSRDSFDTADDCLEAFEAARKVVKLLLFTGHADENVFRFNDDMGGIGWVLYSVDRRVIATNPIPYTSLKDAQRAAESFTTGALQAAVEES